MPEIRRPGVEITQEFVTTSPSIIEPTLSACLVGPCFQIISAFDDNGDPESSAFAGTYRDGNGTVSYDLPGLKDQANISGFEDDIRVFLLLGSAATELNGEIDEQLLIDDATGATYTLAGSVFEDLTALFEQLGIEAGDVVRTTYLGLPIDVPIAAVLSDTQLQLEAGHLPENLTGLTYDVVRDAAQFIVSTGALALTQLGDAADFIQFDVLAASSYAGAAGDSLFLQVVESEIFASGVDGVVGDCIFTSASVVEDFIADIGPVGTVSGFSLFTGNPAVPAGLVLRDILQVVSASQLTIETGEGTVVGLQWSAGFNLAEGADGVITLTTTFTSAGSTFNTPASSTFIPNTAGVPDDPTFIEIVSQGIVEVTTVVSDTELTLAVAMVNDTGLAFTVVNQLAQNGASGSTGALTDFATISVDLTALTGTLSVNFSDVTAPTLAVGDANNGTLGAAGTSGNSLAFKIVDTTKPLALTFDGANETITVQLERAFGLSATTFAEIEDAITNVADPAHNVIVSAIISATLGGTVGTGATILTGTDVPILQQFDGGSADEQLVLDADLIGSTTPTANVFVSYKALRLDVSDAATTPSLLSFQSSTQVEAEIGPISIDNPLALGFFFALANSPTHTVNGVAVSAVSAAKPDGTLAAYTSALEFLEGEEVYFISPLTQDPTVHQVLQVHVDSMSEPENKSERIGMFNTALPLFAKATNVGSGTQGNSGTIVGVNPADFSTSVDLTAAGVTAGDILVVTALASSADSPTAVNGTAELFGITLSGVSGTDDFVAQLDGTTAGLSANWNDLVDVDWTIYRAGAPITSAANQAIAVAEVGEGYADRRMFHIWPDEVFADIGGTNFGVEGFYNVCAWAGKGGEQPPQQGFTNTTVAGFTGLSHANGYFSNSQLNNIAGGGTWITIQESQSAPLKCRHQLATDVSTIQKREFSITKSIDYVARFLRIALSKQIGKFNITQSFLDSLATSIQGLGRYLVESGVVNEFSLSSIEQDETSPDTVNIVVVLGVPFPCNYIALTLQI